MKIAICMPARNDIPLSVFSNFLSVLFETLPKHDIRVLISNTIPLDAARNELAKRALEQNPDYIWWIDSDMIIPKGALDGLLEPGKEIVSGLYFSRFVPHKPVVRMLKDGKYHKLDYLAPNKLLEVDGIGLGCALIKKEVFEEISKDNKIFFEFKDRNGEIFSEDITFCEKAKASGFKIFVNTSVVCGHVGEAYIDENFYSLYLQQELAKNKKETIK